jgi:hypothetical protein
MGRPGGPGPLDPIFDVPMQMGTIAFSGTLTPSTDAMHVTINQSGSQLDPAHISPILFAVVFTEATSDFATGNVVITGTAGGSMTATVADTGDHIHFTITVTGMTTEGTVIANVHQGVCHSTATGIPNSASTSTDNVVTWEPLDCWSDDFNRADGGLGADWSYTAPRLNIVGNAVYTAAFSSGSPALYVGGGGVAPTGVNHAVSGVFYQGSAFGYGAPAVRMKADRTEYYAAGYASAAFGLGDFWYIGRVGGVGGSATLAAIADTPPTQPLSLRLQANDIGAFGTLLVLYDVSDPDNPEPIIAATDASATDLQHVGFGFTGPHDPVTGTAIIAVGEWMGCDSDPDDAMYPSPRITGGMAEPLDATHWVTTMDASTYAVSNSGALAPSTTVAVRGGGSCAIEWLAVAGGGGGGGVIGGGGGAGGLATGSATLSSSQACSVGVGGTAGNNAGAVPTSGGNTTFGSIASVTGGGNGAGATGVGTPGNGGSGGGTNGFSAVAGGTGVGGQGFAGGTGGGGGAFGACGGGGAGAVGTSGTAGAAGNGGNGLLWSAGDGSYYAGGGGGGLYSGAVTAPGSGGLGGGGVGGARSTLYCCAAAGTDRLGGGGGGGGHNDAGATGSPNGGRGGHGSIRIIYLRGA